MLDLIDILNDILNSGADLEVVIAFAISTGLTIAYATLFNWRLTRAGRAFLYFFSSLVLLSIVGGLTVFLGHDFEFRGMLRFVTWATVIAAVVNICRVLFIAFTKGATFALPVLRHHNAEELSSDILPPKKGSEMSNHEPVKFPWQRALRTAFSTIITILPLVPQVIAIVQGVWSADWLTVVAVQAVAINTALSRIMAIPAVNAWLTKFGLGSVPKSEV